MCCVQDNASPEKHASYVWCNLVVQQAKAKHIAVVAHSYGGVVTTHLVSVTVVIYYYIVFSSNGNYILLSTISTYYYVPIPVNVMSNSGGFGPVRVPRAVE